jgi:hypothetical protein
MTRRTRAGALSLTFAFASFFAASGARAQNTVVGHWEGAIIQPSGELKILVDFTTASDTFTGTFDLPDAAVFHWPLKVEYSAPKVRFRLPSSSTSPEPPFPRTSR